MDYSDYRRTIEHRLFTIEGKDYTYSKLLEWTLTSDGDAHIRVVKQLIQHWLDPEVEHMLIATSGSTGNPKQIRLSKAKIWNSARMSISFFQLHKGDLALLVLPADKIGGMMLVIRALIGGMDLRLGKPALNPLKGIAELDYDFCSLTPAQLALIKADPSSLRKLRRIKHILLGGSSIPPDLEQWVKSEENAYFQSYGMTETISHVAVRRLNGKNKSDYYQALPGVIFHISGEQQLVIHAPGIVDGDLLTNDVVEWISDTQFRWMGRLDNVINSGGIKIYPEEVENKLQPFFGNAFYMTGISDPVLGEKLVMVILEEEYVRQKLHDFFLGNHMVVLDKYEIPKQVYIAGRIHYTENNKIKRLPPDQLEATLYPV